MKIGRYNITITKSNFKTCFRFYTLFLTFSLLFNSSRTNNEHLKHTILTAFTVFIFEAILGNYYRNNLHKKKDNWFWRHHQYLN